MTQNVFERQIKIKEVPELLKLGMAINTPVMIMGSAGVGKSSVLQQFANDMFNGKMQIVVLSRHDRADFAVPIPSKVDDKIYRTFNAINELLPTEPCLLIFDEFGQADHSTQVIAQQLMLEGRFMQYVLPKGTYIVAATNRTFDNAGSNEILSTIANRCIMAEIKEDVKGWLEYGESINLHPAMHHFISSHPDLLYGDLDEEGHPSFMSPRSAERVSEVLYEYDKGFVSENILGVAVEGLAGKNIYHKLRVSMETVGKLPKPMDILVGNGKKIDLEKEDIGLAGLYGVFNSCIYLIKQELIANNQEKSIDYTKNFLEYVENNILQEKELITNMVTKINSSFTDNNIPIRSVFVKCPEVYKSLMRSNSQFREQYEGLLKS